MGIRRGLPPSECSIGRGPLLVIPASHAYGHFGVNIGNRQPSCPTVPPYNPRKLIGSASILETPSVIHVGLTCPHQSTVASSWWTTERRIDCSAVDTRPDLHTSVDDDRWSLIVDSDNVDVDRGRSTASVWLRRQPRRHREVVDRCLVAVVNVPQCPSI